jgi:hypothetical protein
LRTATVLLLLFFISPLLLETSLNEKAASDSLTESKYSREVCVLPNMAVNVAVELLLYIPELISENFNADR